MQEPEPLCRKLHVHSANTGDIAARPVEAGNETFLNRVSAAHEDNRNCRGCGFSSESRRYTARCGNDCDLAAYQIGCQFPQLIVFKVRTAVFNRHIPALDIASFAEPFTETRHKFCICFG